jgi:ABC-type glycerol-3-phosphate transport system substrate-binding protein
MAVAAGFAARGCSRRRLLRLAALAAPTLALAGCTLPIVGRGGGPARASVALHLYYGPFSTVGSSAPPEATLLAAILDQFHQHNAGISVTATSLDNLDAGSLAQLFNPLSADQGDLFLSLATLPSMDVDQVPVSLTNVITPVDAYLKRDRDVTSAAFYPAAIARATIDGHIIGLPRDIQPEQVVLFNRTLLQQAGLPAPSDGWSLDEFLRLAQDVVRVNAGKQPPALRYGYVDESAETSFYDFIYLSGGRRTTLPPDPPRITLDTAPAVAGAQSYVDLTARYQVAALPLERGVYESDPLIDFMLGHVPLLVAPVAALSTLHGMQRPLDWDFTMLPLGQGVKEAWYGAGAAVYLARISRHLDEAWTLAKDLCAGPGIAQRAQIGDVHPAAKAIAESSAYLSTGSPSGRRLFNSVGMDHMIPVDPAVSLARLGLTGGPLGLGTHQPKYAAAAAVIHAALDDMLTGKQQVAAVLRRATQAGNAGLAS